MLPVPRIEITNFQNGWKYFVKAYLPKDSKKYQKPVRMSFDTEEQALAVARESIAHKDRGYPIYHNGELIK